MSKHGVITPIFDATVRQGLRAFGVDDSADPFAYWKTPRGEYEIRSALYNAPLIGGWMRHNEHMQEMDAALGLYGLDYSDIRYTSKTLGADGTFSSSFGYVSDNLSELYK